MAKAQKRIRIVTPAGVAKFPYLTTPDTKFNADGEYRTGLVLDPANADAQEFLEKLDALAAEAVEKAKEDLIANAKTKKLGEKAAAAVIAMEPYRQDLDADGEETGKVEVRFKMKAKVTKKDGTVVHLAPRLFGADGKPLKEGTTVYGGAIIKVNFSPIPYYNAATKGAGISLQLNAVQVIQASGGADASFYGFEAEETGDDEASDASDEEAPAGEEDDF